MTPKKKTTPSQNIASGSGSGKKRKQDIASGSGSGKKSRHSGEHATNAEKFQEKIQKQHAKNRANEEADFTVVHNQKALMDMGQKGPMKERVKVPKKVSGSVSTTIDSWFTDTPCSQMNPSEKETEEAVLKKLFDDYDGASDDEGVAVNTGVAVNEDVTKKSAIFDTGGRGRKACKGGCGKFIPSVTKNEACVTTGKHVNTGNTTGKPVTTGKTTGKPVTTGNTTETSDTTGKPDTDGKTTGTSDTTGKPVTAGKPDSIVKHVTTLTGKTISKFPGCDVKDVGKEIFGTEKNEPKSIITGKHGERTGETLTFPEYSSTIRGVATLHVGTLVDSKKKAYAATLVTHVGTTVTSVLADAVEKFASDAELFKFYGHITEWIGSLENENIVIMEHLKDFPIVNAYYTDISKFIPKKTLEIGELTVREDRKGLDLIKLSIAGWKNDGTGIAISGTVFTFGDDNGKNDIRMIILTPILTLMSYNTFCSILPCRYPTDNKLMTSLVDEKKLDSELVKTLGYSEMAGGWKSKEFLKEYLKELI